MNRNVKNIEISGIRKFSNKVSKFEDAISLTLGQPDFDVPNGIKDEMKKALEDGKSGYTSNIGIIELREEISKYLKKDLNINYNNEDILITVGGSEGLFASMMAVLETGDKILVPEIGYPAYESIPKMLGVTVCHYELNDDFSINIDSIKKGIDDGAKVMVLSYPSNPTGALLDKKTKEKLINLIKSEDILVITDEIYSALCFEDEYHSVAQCDEIVDKIIYVSGFSKMFSMTGLRLGYVACKETIMKEILKVHQYNVSCAPSIVQWGAVGGLKHSLKDVEIMKDSFNERMEFVYNELKCMGLEVNKPKGAFYIFPSIKKFNMTSEEFCERLLNEKKVACVPGSAFLKGGEGYMRISYCYSMDNLKLALGKLKEFVNGLEK